MNDRSRKKKINPGTIIAILVLLFAASPEMLGSIIGLAIIIGIFASPFIIIHLIRKHSGASTRTGNTPRQSRESFDECPKPICFHRDKGEHHVRKGREIDPWDRPDIDIRKYQRRQ